MKTLAIRAEDKNIWERRTPLIPDHVHELVSEHGIRVMVEPSSLRVFPDQAFASAGAVLVADPAEAEVIIGVKEVPTEKISPDRIYLYFSHTIKGQPGNMPMLRRIIESGSTLLDYERIVDDSGRRLIFFGNFAGDAGAVDILWLIGQELHRRGVVSPLSEVRQALTYASLSEAKEKIAAIGRAIGQSGFPPMLNPFVVGLFGYGNVSKGAQEIFDLFPVRRIDPEDLPGFIQAAQFDPGTMYLSIFQERHMVRSKSRAAFDLQEYYRFPERYEAVTEPFLPYFKLIVNAVYWTERYPRFVTKDMVRRLWEASPQPPFLAIADLSCDLNGSIELTVKSTDPGNPAFKFQPLSGTISDNLNDDGIIILAVDNLPCEFAYDASFFFGSLLKTFIPPLLAADFSQPLDKTGLPPELQRAVIVQRGKLTPAFAYLETNLSR